MMDKRTVEILAVSAVKKSVALVEILSPYVQEDDKVPSWDGFVYIYKSTDKQKSNLSGRVAVQVKGEENSDFSKKCIKDDASVADLRNYRYDGGVIYFVVYINHDKAKIYFNALTPVKLKIILSQAEAQETKRIELTEFPNEPKRIAEIFLNFLIDSRMQASFATTDMLSLEDVEKNKYLQGLTISVSGFATTPEEYTRLFFQNESYVYADIAGSSIPHPVDFIPENLYIRQEFPCRVHVCGREYYNKFSRVDTKETATYFFGNSFAYEFPYVGEFEKIMFTPSPYLRIRAHDSAFIIDALANGGFSLGDIDILLSLSKEEMQSCHLAEQINELEHLKKAVLALDTINVDKDLNLDEFTEREFMDLDILVIAFADRVPITKLHKDLPKTSCMTIRDVKILLYFEQSEEDETTYRVYDFFRSPLAFSYSNENGENCITSPYSMVDKDGYATLSNIDYNAILPSYQAIFVKNPEIFGRANNDMLIMLLAFDEGGRANEKLFAVVKAINDWIQAEDKENVLPSEVKTLNTFQIALRERGLTTEEKRLLQTMADDGSQRADFRAGAYLLLDNQLAAEKCFSEMEPKLLEQFKEYPIYAFYKH